MGRALDGTLRFRRWKRSRALNFEEMSPISGYLPSNARWRSEGKARPRENEMAVPPRVLTRQFRRWDFDSSHWLFYQCFRAPSSNTSERSQSNNGRPKSKAEFRTPIVDLLCVNDGWRRTERWSKKSRSIFLKEQLNTRCSGWRNKVIPAENRCRGYGCVKFTVQSELSQLKTGAGGTDV